MTVEKGTKIKNRAEPRKTDMKIGVFGGAFNPVHNGHLHLMNCFFNELKLDKLILIPTSVPPHKDQSGLLSGTHRINMLKLAVDNKLGIEISDIEFKRSGKSYTYDTLSQLKKEYPEDEFYLIVGSDQYLHFNSWYRYEDILTSVTLVTAAREENEYKILNDFKNKNSFLKNSMISTFGVVKVSSSQVRQMIADGRDVSHLIPSRVYNYIKENELYV